MGKIDELIQKVVDTLKFHGVSINNMSIEDDVPEFDISINLKDSYEPTDRVLNLAYWSLWCLIYGEYTEDKSELKISLNYKVVS